MKKLTLSIAAIAAMGTFAVAGGDIAPVEPVVETPVVAPTDAGFYLGLAYSYIDSSSTVTGNGGKNFDIGDNYDSAMLQAGYKVNPYVAVEGRYWLNSNGNDYTFTTTGNTMSTDVDAWGIYVKPMYPVTDAFDIYALLGYGSTTLNSVENAAGSSKLDADADGFSWGLGAAYSFTNNWSVFVDYVEFADQDTSFPNGAKVNVDIATWNFGVTYKF